MKIIKKINKKQIKIKESLDIKDSSGFYFRVYNGKFDLYHTFHYKYFKSNQRHKLKDENMT